MKDFKAAQPIIAPAWTNALNVMEKLSQLLIYAVHLELITEAGTRGVLWKKVFLEISQNFQEKTCTRVIFLK